MHGSFAGVRGPFTPSQWIELEHQALIYKYITSNVAVPSNLLFPLKRSLYPYGLSGSATGSSPYNSCNFLYIRYILVPHLCLSSYFTVICLVSAAISCTVIYYSISSDLQAFS